MHNAPNNSPPPHPCEIVAEIGTAHNGDYSRSEHLIAELAHVGVNSIKTQIIFADELLHPLTPALPINGTLTALHQRFRALERPFSFYKRMQRICEAHHISFFASVFGKKSMCYAVDLGCTRVKVASPELNHLPLLEDIAASTLPAIISTGTSRLADIETALTILDPARTTLLHCVTAYPARAEDYNLCILPHYRALFSVAVGVSDHSPDPLLVPSVALLHNATMIEKHAQCADDPAQLDAAVAITPAQFSTLIDTVRMLEALNSIQKERYLHQHHGSALVRQISGDGTKRLTAHETSHYHTTNRSIRAAVNIDAGSPLTEENCIILRGETLGGGLHPALWSDIRGTIAQQHIPAGHGITLSALLIQK